MIVLTYPIFHHRLAFSVIYGQSFGVLGIINLLRLPKKLVTYQTKYKKKKDNNIHVNIEHFTKVKYKRKYLGYTMKVDKDLDMIIINHSSNHQITKQAKKLVIDKTYYKAKKMSNISNRMIKAQTVLPLQGNLSLSKSGFISSIPTSSSWGCRCGA